MIGSKVSCSYPVGGSKVSEYAYKENYYSTNIYSDYFKQLDNGHYFKAMVGFNAELYKDRSVSADKSTLITPSVPGYRLHRADKQAVLPNVGYWRLHANFLLHKFSSS